MKKRFIVIYTIFASLFMFISVGFMGLNIYKEYKEGNSRSASIFANTVFKLYSNLAEIDESKSNYYKKIATSAGDLNDYSFFEIKKNNTPIFTYPSGSNKNDTASNFTKNFETDIKINDDIIFNVNCNIFILRPYSIYYYSRLAFLMILGITLLTIILIIVSNKRIKNTLPVSADSKEQLENENIESKEEISEDLNDSIEIKKVEVQYDRNNDTEQDVNNIEELDNSDEDITEEQTENESSSLEESVIETKDEQPLNSENKPEGLFSTSTGLGWESYLLTRLENEINRAISTEMDLSIFVIKLSKLGRKTELCRNICNYLAEQFQFRDLLFEYKEDCIVAIETGANLDDALALGEKIHSDITKMLSGTDSKCYMGISTRSVRMISNEQFLKEADEALIHAQEDENSPIIAFRADIEKYRKYLEQKFDE